MKRRRVKITGIGPVTPAGIGREAFWKGILEPVSRVTKFKGIDPKYGHFVAAHLPDFDVEDYLPRSEALKSAARHTLFAAVAAKLALGDAGMDVAEANLLNPAFVAGACLMDFDGICRTVESVLDRPTRGGIPRTVFTTNAACIPAVAADALGLKARTITVQSSCASGLDAIGHGARMISDGDANLVICGGTDAPLSRTPLVELRAAGLTPATCERSQQLCRPFDLWRTTGVISEGAAMVVLEPESSPRRGYCFVSGYAFANDPPGDLCGGLAEAISLALGDARVRPGDVESISAWGPGHKLVDAAEVRALQNVFGDLLPTVPAYSIKGSIGSPLSAAPSMQVAAAALAHRFGTLPPTVNWEFPDPECNLNLSSKSRSIAHRITLLNAHGLSGVNASLVLTQ